jgi:ribose transport system permease protein
MSLGRYMPLSTILWLIIALIFILIMRRTTLGRRIYAVGSNPTTARLSGVNVNLIIIFAYVICGILSAGAGFLLLGYLGLANLRFTDIYTMGSIAAAVVGGTTFFTGIGTIEGTIAGTLIIRFLFNLLIMFRIPEAGRMVANGMIIILVVALYSVRRRR